MSTVRFVPGVDDAVVLNDCNINHAYGCLMTLLDIQAIKTVWVKEANVRCVLESRDGSSLVRHGPADTPEQLNSTPHRPLTRAHLLAARYHDRLHVLLSSHPQGASHGQWPRWTTRASA